MKAPETDPRFVKLHEYHELELETTCYGLGATNEKKDYSIKNPLYTCFYDSMEPDWMSSIEGYTRMQAYENVIYNGRGYLSRPYSHYKFDCIGLTGGLTVLNVAMFSVAWLLPKQYETIVYYALCATNLPSIAYIGNHYYQGTKEEKSIEARMAHYRNKSMEYIIRESNERKLGYLDGLTIPKVEEPKVEEMAK